jgi:anionic cell wall polymer biosynthesis LytR-Cps2A-Psr (LCP) family protein
MVDPLRRPPAVIHGLLRRACSASLALLVGFVGNSARGVAVGCNLQVVGDRARLHARLVRAVRRRRRRGSAREHPCNYLLLGSDSRAGLTYRVQHQFVHDKDIGGAETTGLLLGNVMLVQDPRSRRRSVISFPRDLWSTSTGRLGQSINAAFEGGLEAAGRMLMANTVANLTGLPIDHYLYVDLAGSRTCVDTSAASTSASRRTRSTRRGWLSQHTASGVDRRSTTAMPGQWTDPNTGWTSFRGVSTSTGSRPRVRAHAEPSVRRDPDFARIGRQQQFLRAVINQMLRPSELARAPGLVQPVLANLHRDQGFLPGELVYLVGQLRGLTTGAVEFRQVPGVAGMRGSEVGVLMDPAAGRSSPRSATASSWGPSGRVSSTHRPPRPTRRSRSSTRAAPARPEPLRPSSRTRGSTCHRGSSRASRPPV